ncbi:DUF2846 domain-containing protein [Marinobacter zhejiangensis]|uniref:DUF2846 domain-containing protein n=1 Tax=Marinobacter zhejiangensis TaxID=488535 RepID=A0A1I4QSC8_9GAMM|nr:DUF2846 domain-containing protein [Marinobacter zhejiangensis]SFM42941.1 Protein of unknown function [Marinobacter zhejiangensis]
MKPSLLAKAAMALSFTLLSGCLYQSIGKSTGAFLHPVSGHNFVHIGNDEWSRSNALLYFYRTHSQWAADEIEAPSVYIDDSHYFNIRDNSFTWLEVSPGERHIAIRRPLLGLEGMGGFSLSLIADANLMVEPGKVYYLRYNELSEPETPHPDLDPEHPLATGDLQLVTREVAMAFDEIVSTRFLNSDLLAPNHAATSIVEDNQDAAYERDMARLDEEREEEIERLTAEGRYQESPWYWPFGGEATPLETDRKIRERENAYAMIERERERQQELADQASGGWWPF